jgi:23S rRNA pseudouridine2457 synthase
MDRYFLMYKPFKVWCQFSREGTGKQVLGDVFPFPAEVYPLGRLDEDSEGVLLLSSERSLMARYANGRTEKEYWVQVEGQATAECCKSLEKGITVRIKGKEEFLKAQKAELLEHPVLPERNPPIRFRKEIPDSWIRIVLTEGKNRQVRRMTAAVGFPTLRLVRFRIGSLNVQGMNSGEIRELSRKEFLEALK